MLTNASLLGIQRLGIYCASSERGRHIEVGCVGCANCVVLLPSSVMGRYGRECSRANLAKSACDLIYS
jgi:hypothetical protein